MSMWLARLQDAMAIWDGSPRPCKSFWLRVKASICIALGREAYFLERYYDFVPVWASPPWNNYSYDGPDQSWQEVAVTLGWRWQFSRYTNGF